jgi:uncharacterized delta-60 repeat protein
VVLQPDGRVVAAGTSGDCRCGSAAPVSNLTLVRFDRQGRPDRTFGKGGQTVAPANGDSPVALVLQTDGKLVAAGGRTLVRFSTSGRLDASFGQAGKVTMSSSNGGMNKIEALTLQPDGKLVAAGCGTAAVQKFALVRFTRRGGLDTSFGHRGTVTTSVGGGEGACISGLALQSDGKFVAVSSRATGSLRDPVTGVRQPETVLVRYETDGRIDRNFGRAGRAAVGHAVALENPLLVIDSDGSLIVSGNNAGTSQIILIRLDANGHPS